MKAIILKEPGLVDNLLIRDIQLPETGINEVLIKVKSVSINPVDVKTRKGEGIYNYGNVNYDATTGSLGNLLSGSIDSVPQFLVRLAKIIFILLGGVAAIVILVGAFRMAMSQGNQEGLSAAKRNITWAVIGLVVAILSYSIVAILQSFIGVK